MMGLIKLGNTDISVSRLGLGTVKFGRNEGVKYPQPFELPSDKHILNLLALAHDLGINLLDTAPAYGLSEERLGKLLKGGRQQWVLATKVGEEFENQQSSFNFSAEHLQKSIERSLKRLKTDYLDVVLVHSDGNDQQLIEVDRVFDTLKILKTKGMIRAIGMSTKTVEGGLLTLEHADIAMVTYNSNYPDEKQVIDYAKQQNKSIFIKKALDSGHLKVMANQDSVLQALQFVFKEPGVSSIIVGTLNSDHLQHNVNCAIRALS
jgi:aryl-alcohol dehydrogenase-like predicted oxidoreductase